MNNSNPAGETLRRQFVDIIDTSIQINQLMDRIKTQYTCLHLVLHCANRDAHTNFENIRSGSPTAEWVLSNDRVIGL